jgi:type IV pilus assembly protein PilP
MILIGLMAVAAGCKKKPEQPVSPLPPPVKATVPAKPVQRQVSSSRGPSAAQPAPFDVASRKDPFKPWVMSRADGDGTARRQRKESLPIHSYDVGQFRLIGIITGAGENRAMVVDPQGKGYVLRTGMTIGRNEGRITAISGSGVTVAEQFRDDSGRLHREQTTIVLPRKQ